MHGIRTLEVGGDFGKDAFLRGGGLEGKNAFDGGADFFLAHAHGDAAALAIARTPQSKGQLVVEEFLENEAHLRWAAKTIEQLDAFVPGREVRVEQGFAPGGKAIALANLKRQRVGNISFEIIQDGVDDAAEHARADGADGFVNRDDAADLGGIRSAGAGFCGADKFDLGIDHLRAAEAIQVGFHFAVQHQVLPLLQPVREISAVEEARVERAGCVANGEMKDGAAAAYEADRSASAARDFGVDRVHLAWNDLGDGRKAETVLVTKGKVAEQIADRGEPAFIEQRGAMRSDASQVFHRIVQGDGHAKRQCYHCRMSSAARARLQVGARCPIFATTFRAE